MSSPTDQILEAVEHKHESVVVYLPRTQWERIAEHFRKMESPDDEYYGAPWGYWAKEIEDALTNPGNVRKKPRLP